MHSLTSALDGGTWSASNPVWQGKNLEKGNEIGLQFSATVHMYEGVHKNFRTGLLEREMQIV